MSDNPLKLTDREVLIVTAWATGRDDEWTAEFVGRRTGTIRAQSAHLFAKLGVHSRTHATAIVLREILRATPRDETVPRGPRSLTITQLAHGARRAVRDGVDPELALSYVIWPPDSLNLAA